MAFIGFSESGVTDLLAEISSRKQKLLDILAGFADVDTAINECWKGPDADSYREELNKVIESTKSSVSDAYDALEKQCRVTYEDWVSKQSGN